MTNRRSVAFVVMLVLALCIVPLINAFAASIGNVGVYFSPNGGATEAIVREIDKSQAEILVQAYSFTSKPIAEALLRAHRRGVKVYAVLDRSQKTERYTSATFLHNAGVPVFIDDRHPIAHNKVMVIDRQVVVSGSFNFTAAGEKNAENLLIMRDCPELVAAYYQNFSKHYEHSFAYQR